MNMKGEAAVVECEAAYIPTSEDVRGHLIIDPSAGTLDPPVQTDTVTGTRLNDMEMIGIRSLSALVEIAGGQPLDRLKINMQLPRSERVPLRDLLTRGIGEFYTASTTSIIQRCFFYIPALYLGYDVWDRNFKLEDDTWNGIMASCFASAVVTPGVSCFENLKTEQQLLRNRSVPMSTICRSLFVTHGFFGVFPSLLSTFARESVFACGICFLTPTLHSFLKERNFDSVVVAGCATGLATQLATHPFDTIKTWQENKKTGFVASLRDIVRKEGLSFFWNGAVPRCARGMWTFTCLYMCVNNFSSFYSRIKDSVSMMSV